MQQNNPSSLLSNMQQSVNGVVGGGGGGGGVVGITNSSSVHSVIPNFIPNSTNAPSLPNFPVLSNADNGIGLSQPLPVVVGGGGGIGGGVGVGPVVVVANNQTNTLHEEKPFECDFCESRFMTKISLKQHLDGKHSDQAKYCCEKCGKGYFWNASYNYHKKKCMMKPLIVTNLSN